MTVMMDLYNYFDYTHDFTCVCEISTSLLQRQHKLFALSFKCKIALSLNPTIDANARRDFSKIF